MGMPALKPFFTESAQTHLDDLLREVCEDLQLSPSRYRLAEQRYGAVTAVLESAGSPFRHFRPLIYPQGSMRLRTTVKPVDGPHDLDFVCELDVSHLSLDPPGLLDGMFRFLHDHGTYKGMVERKNRCVRIIYADEFHMDVLPACKDRQAGGTCVRVPDRALRDWTPSNPIGYAEWFEERAIVEPELVMERAEPIPAQQGVEEKRPLQLAVQLIKRWRDLHFDDQDLAPISIVLTTLAGHFYQGARSVSAALSSVLELIVRAVASAELAGSRLVVPNPRNRAEDLSERWDENPKAYEAFKRGMWHLLKDWRAVLNSASVPYKALEALFGEPVQRALAKQAARLQEARRADRLGVQRSGVISSAASAVVAIRPNVFHGTR